MSPRRGGKAAEATGRFAAGAGTPWSDLARAIAHPLCQGLGPIQLVARQELWDEEELPFIFEGGGTIAHIVPDPGFRKESLAGSEDERLLIVDCPDDEGWLVPEDIVADWMGRNVSNPDLDDILLSHPLYEYLTANDEEGLSRGGRGELVQWAPGIPTLASLHAPEFLPNDPEAPGVNRDRAAYAEAVRDLLEQLDGRFGVAEVELGLRLGDPPKRDPDADAAA
jgi:hypothetical protein